MAAHIYKLYEKNKLLVTIQVTYNLGPFMLWITRTMSLVIFSTWRFGISYVAK